MEDADFVAESDEDEQEMLDAQNLTADRHTRQHIETDAASEPTREQEQTMTLKQPLTFKEQHKADDKTVKEQFEAEVADEEHELAIKEKERVLDVGTLVDVDSRTWPGINKLGGAGRIARVDREEPKDGDGMEVFYDVRYVLGGFERHIESKWVHSSELLNKHSNREKVGRDYYHDDFINKPHREAEKRRERRMTRAQQTDILILGQRKRKRVERVDDKSEQDQNEAEKNRQKISESDKDVFVLLEEKNGLFERSSRPLNDKLKLVGQVDGPQSPLLKQPTRRRNRISDSSDEESSDDDANHNASSDRSELVQRADTGSNEPLVKGKSAQGRCDRKLHRQKQRAKHRRYVGGYERNGEDADAMFIQPEGDPAELPEDVIRETGLKLASTKKELMGQLEEIFAQQQKNMANFHDEQNMVNQQFKNLAEMSLADLRGLYTKICDLRTFVTKTLVNAGEDAMNKIIDSLHVKRGKPPGALEHLECNIDVWQIDLNECSSWLKNVESAMESAFARRGEETPQEDEAHAACLSDSGESSYHMDEYDATTFSSETTKVGDLHSGYHELDFSYDYEQLREENDASKQLGGRSECASKEKIRALKPPRTAAAAYYRKHVARNTTLDDYFPRRGFSNGFTLNVRLVGRQEKILPSDPRWHWLKMARKNLQRIGKTTSPSPIRFSDGVDSARTIQEKGLTNVSRRSDSKSVQMQLMRLRDKRFRAQASQYRSRESFLAPQNSGSASKYVYPAGLSFDNVNPAKSLRAAESIDPTIHPDCSKQLPIDWETVFEVVSDSPIASTYWQHDAPISRQVQVVLPAFGHEICGPLAPHHLLCDEDYTFEDCDSIHDVVKRRAARLRQLANDLRLQESSFMDSLSRGEMEVGQEEGCAAALEWVSLVSLEEAYHTAIASFAAQLLEALDAASPIAVANYLQEILYEIAALIRQLPDCDSLFTGCKAYFFFFEVVSTDAATTPFLTAISRTYWYCLKLLVAIQSRCNRLIGPHATIKKEIEHIFLTTLPVNRVTLAVMLFLFDLYIYLPSSHCLEDRGKDQPLSGQLPALSLWMLIRDCCTSSIGLDQPQQESLATKEKHVWALLQAGYRQRYFDELAWCFVQGESCGGYLRDYAPQTTDRGTTGNCNEVLTSQLLALEVTWNLLAVLTRIYADDYGNEHEEAVCDAKWAVVKDLLHPGKQDFLPFEVSDGQRNKLQLSYRQLADIYTQHVLQRITQFSQLWLPCKEVIEIILRQLWDNDVLYHPDNIGELPQLLKQFITRCKEFGNSRSSLAAFAGEASFDNPDSTTMLCKIIWIQLLKLEKRVHRSRFRRSVLSAIPDIPDSHDNTTFSIDARSVSARQIVLKKKSGTDWSWGSQQQTSASIQPADQPMAVSQRAPTSFDVGKERMSTAVLLTFAIVGICLECGDEQQFPTQRSDKDIRYMEREVDFYCKEILRRISRKSQCEVLASQALYTLGALLLEKSSTEFSAVFWGLNDRLESSVKNLHGNFCVFPNQSAETKVNAIKARSMDRRRRRFQSATMSSLYQMRDLIKKVLEIPSSGVRIGPAYGSAVEKCLEYVFGSGMEACLNGAVQNFVAVNDLKIAMEIFHLVLPRSSDEPKQCVTSEFDDFTDEALATFDLEGAIAGHNAAPVPAWAVNECQHKAIQLLTRNLRVALQQLVLNYPPSDVPAFDELYAIDLLGMIISTSGSQFFWSNVTSTSVKHRFLASHVLSAALKYNADKEWLGSVFLRESGADRELVTAWLLGTLDVSSLNPAPIIFEVGDVPFSVRHATPSHATGANAVAVPSVRLSNSWVMLTDGILYQMLRKEPGEFRNMDSQIWQLLRGVVSTCKFPAEVSANEDGIHDVSTLYDLHLDVFQSFCKSAGGIWRLYNASPETNRDEKNQFRTKMVNQQFGIFVSFLEAFKINFRRACGEIDQMNHNWHSFAELFLRQAGVDITNGRSYHEMDDTIKSFDERLTGLTTMFRFMYQCMDAFLFYCGDMAIGETNLFLDAMEMLFRQVNSAEYPQALKRLEDQRLLGHRKRTRNVNDDLRQEFCPAAVRFVDSVQLFFARQKYPSLLHWFAQTSEIYQTYKNGWQRSPLRTLLMNILDPDGPLGIHSYYGISSDSPDVRIVRREAFYLSCGLFNCRCTRSFEHSRAQLSSSSCTRLQHLRHFVLNDFMRETFVFARQQDVTSLLETMVPVYQFVRGVLNHANLNVNAKRANQGGECAVGSPPRSYFQLSELQPCLEWMVACLIKLVPGEEAVNDAISCVLVIELCGIVCEAVAFNEHKPMLELIDLVKLVLSYLQTISVALSKRTTATNDALLTSSVGLPPSEKLRSYCFFSSAFRDIVVKEQSGQVPSRQMDSYGISMARAVTDLLAAIGRVAQQCQVSSDEQLQSFTTL